MSEQLRESLSAAMDGEADAFELRRVLDEAKQNDELRDQWHRFQLASDLIRENVKTYHPGLRSAIWEELNSATDEEENIAELVLADQAGGGEKARSPWLGRITGTAVAAAVAVLVMVNGGVFDSPEVSDTVATNQTLPVGAEIIPVMYPDATPQDLQRQNGRMLSHIQHRAMNQAGVASFVKLVTFQGDPSEAPAASGQAPAASGQAPVASEAEQKNTPEAQQSNNEDPARQ